MCQVNTTELTHCYDNCKLRQICCLHLQCPTGNTLLPLIIASKYPFCVLCCMEWQSEINKPWLTKKEPSVTLVVIGGARAQGHKGNQMCISQAMHPRALSHRVRIKLRAATTFCFQKPKAHQTLPAGFLCTWQSVPNSSQQLNAIGFCNFTHSTLINGNGFQKTKGRTIPQPVGNQQLNQKYPVHC